MGLDYSYSQPSPSEVHGCSDSGYSTTDDLIRQDQAELGYNNSQMQEEAELSYNWSPVQYPPQPEVEFGFPQICYYGARPQLATCRSRNDPGRRYYTCANADDRECHVWKWWDETVMEEMKARDVHTLHLAEKVDSLASGIGDESQGCSHPQVSLNYETEQRLVRLEQKVSELTLRKTIAFNGFGVEYLVVGIVLVLVAIGMVLMSR